MKKRSAKPLKLKLSRQTLYAMSGGTTWVWTDEPVSRLCPKAPNPSNDSCTVNGSGMTCCSTDGYC